MLRDDGYELQLIGFSDDELAEMLPEVIDAEHAAEEERRENAVPEAANFATSAEGIAFNGAFYPAPQGFTLVDPPAPKPADFEPGRYQYSAGVLVRLPDPPAPSPTQAELDRQALVNHLATMETDETLAASVRELATKLRNVL